MRPHTKPPLLMRIPVGIIDYTVALFFFFFFWRIHWALTESKVKDKPERNVMISEVLVV